MFRITYNYVNHYTEDDVSYIDELINNGAEPNDITIIEMSEEQIEALEYLKSTDWYTARKVDSDIDIPPMIIDARQVAREML